LIINEYPYMRMAMAAGSVGTTRELPGKSIIIIYFPDCDHCQREATEINNHIKAFENYQIWFISTASFVDIQRFAKKFVFAGNANIHFAQTQIEDVIRNFGSIPTPSVFIYSAERKLVKAFKGETRIEEILKYL
jgi:peroxiredoxin